MTSLFELPAAGFSTAVSVGLGGPGTFDPQAVGADVDPAVAAAERARERAERARERAEQLLDGLNPPQREAVQHRGAPLLVVAGIVYVMFMR